MKKKNIAILLLLPYLIALLGVLTVNITFKVFENDIAYISWSYKDIEAFKMGDGVRYQLKATGVTASNAPLAQGNDLVWSVANSDGAEEPHAKIEESNGKTYLVPLSEGEVTLTCSNEKGNVTRRTTVIIYVNSVIFVRTRVQSSQNNIDNTLYYGEYDLKNGEKVPAEIALEVVCYPEALKKTVEVVHEENLKIDTASGTVRDLSPGKASFVLRGGFEEDGTLTTFQYSFEVVDEGVNVYTYDDLMNCTNRSDEGEIVVLRKSFESLENFRRSDVNNVVSFGDYNSKTGKFSFAKYSFQTTYNRNYIDQWNAFAKKDSYYKQISDRINVGIRVQKDFYGNGYTINLHNLTFPYDVTEYTDQNGKIVSVPTLRSDNIFRGPLPLYTLGNPNNMPLISLYGQDNIGMYIDGDNITVNDVNLKNCDIGESFSNLQYVGTVMEINGDGVTVKNSVLQNGKHVVRAFSAEELLIDNCLLQNALNFLLVMGSNNYIPIDGSQTYTFKTADGETVTATLDDFLDPTDESNTSGNELLNQYLAGKYDSAKMRAALEAIQRSLNSGSEGLPYDGSAEVKDTLFYRSGIASVCMESSFNGPFLYSKAPSLITDLFGLVTENSRPVVPMTPEKVTGVSYPVELNLTGKTKFYDYKTQDDLDLTYLINENISAVAQDMLESMGQSKDVTVTIDDIFPLKSMLYGAASKNGCLYGSDGKSYLNVTVAFYGGGANLSRVTYEGLENADCMGDAMAVDWLASYLPNQVEFENVKELFSNPSAVKGMMQKMVTVVTGTESFRFVCMKGDGYLFGETPRVAELRENNQSKT
ncbi:MAG: hypothetical protein IJW29_08595 [Clostridia bacterium]|nr:hypothetical protein [Clostridia bacterium]